MQIPHTNQNNPLLPKNKNFYVDSLIL